MSHTNRNLERTIEDLVVGAFSPAVTSSFRTAIGALRSPLQRFFVDIVNDEKNIYIYAELPGLKVDDIDIDFYNTKVTITAEKTRNYNEPEQSEISFGKFQRVITLPICVTRKDSVNVSYNHGILKIKINKLIEEENKFSIKPTSLEE